MLIFIDNGDGTYKMRYCTERGCTTLAEQVHKDQIDPQAMALKQREYERRLDDFTKAALPGVSGAPMDAAREAIRRATETIAHLDRIYQHKATERP